jgi:calcineurin-like phosphoesterase family protein
MQYYLTADFHLGHFRIIEYTHRPFKTVERMDEVLIHNWNTKVKPADTVFFLGDFCFKGSGMFDFYRKQLNGNIIFIKGNHDDKSKIIMDSCTIIHKGERLNLVHNPDHADPRFRINLCAHVHDKMKFKETIPQHYIINVGCDQWNFKPISIEEALGSLYKWINQGKIK